MQPSPGLHIWCWVTAVNCDWYNRVHGFISIPLSDNCLQISGKNVHCVYLRQQFSPVWNEMYFLMKIHEVKSDLQEACEKQPARMNLSSFHSSTGILSPFPVTHEPCSDMCTCPGPITRCTSALAFFCCWKEGLGAQNKQSAWVLYLSF